MIDQSRLAPHASLSWRPWEGVLDKKPADYRVTAAISHNNCPESLFAVLELLRGQGLAPYLVVIDTGSPAPVVGRLLEYEADHEDFEVHLIRGRGWSSPVQPVTAAMDLAFATCRTEYLYSTHADVFLKRPDALEFLVGLCSADHPAVGYQMSPRPASEGLWARCLGHSATVYHMPTMRRIGARWDILAACDRTGNDPAIPESWPDTEVNVSLDLMRAGYRPAWVSDPDADELATYLFVGDEPNRAYSTALLRHERVGASSMIYYRGTTEGEIRKQALEREASLVPARLAEWRDYPSAPTLADVLPAIRSCPFASGSGCTRSCSKLARDVSIDDCFYCQLGPPEGEVIESIGYDWLGEPPTGDQ